MGSTPLTRDRGKRAVDGSYAVYRTLSQNHESAPPKWNAPCAGVKLE
jgi:hypothetical protein